MSLINQLSIPKDETQCVHVDKVPMDTEPFYYMVRCPRAKSDLVHTDSGASLARHGFLCEAHRAQLEGQYRPPRPTIMVDRELEQTSFLIEQERRVISQVKVVNNFGLKSVEGVSMSFDPEPYHLEAERFLAIMRERDKAKKEKARS